MPSPVVAWWRILTVSSASVLTVVPAGDCLRTNSLLQLSTLNYFTQSQSYFTTACLSQSIHLGAKPLEAQDKSYFIEPLRS
jgi:hypothetical protein